MISDLFFYQLLLVGLLWLCLMLHGMWPSERVIPGATRPPPPLPPRKRSREPKPFAGLTHKPPCVACEQAGHPPTVQPPPAPPPRRHSPRGRPRQVDTSWHFCPHPHCAYRGWVGLGNIRANGLPTICQPPWVSFFTPFARPTHDEFGWHHSRYHSATWPPGCAAVGR